MKKYIDYFLNYLQTEKDAAKSTIHKYRADIEKLFDYLRITDINEINQNHLRDYLNHIRQTYNYTLSSITNKINILHHFFMFFAKVRNFNLQKTRTEIMASSVDIFYT